MQVINIFATENVKNAFVRQPIEFYLAHKILESPEIYSKAKEGNSYKIVDCSACELGAGVDMSKVLKAARIVKASEIVLPDIVMTNESLDISLEALNSLTQKEVNEFNIAIVIQGKTLNDAIFNIERLSRNHDATILVDTIMIPKWFSTTSRMILTKKVMELMPCKTIHWLGLGDDIFRCINIANDLNIRSLDTGYFMSVAQKNVDCMLISNRNTKHKIDLQHNRLSERQIREVIAMTNEFTSKNNMIKHFAERHYDEVRFKSTLQKVVSVSILLPIIIGVIFFIIRLILK